MQGISENRSIFEQPGNKTSLVAVDIHTSKMQRLLCSLIIKNVYSIRANDWTRKNKKERKDVKFRENRRSETKINDKGSRIKIR